MKSSHRFPLRRQIVWGMRFFTFLTSLAVGASQFILTNKEASWDRTSRKIRRCTRSW